MKDLVDYAINFVSDLGVTYGDVRIIKQQFEDLKISNGKVDELRLRMNYGFVIRVIANGSWGFSSSNVVSKDEIKRIGKNALAIAKASATTKRKDVRLIDIKTVKDSWETSVQKDPFKVTLEEKLAILQETVQIARETDPKVKVANAYYKGVEEDKMFNNRF